jgi:hypothetical protein
MVLLRQFSKSDKVYGKDGTESEVRSHKAVDVWWDPPCPPASGRPVLAAVRLGVLSALPYIFTVAARRKTGFLYNAIVGRSREDILVDTGAFQNFMCRAAAARSGAVINLDKTLGTVRCAGEQEMAIIGWTEISIKLGSYLAVVQFLVVEKLIAEAGVILGLPWLDDNKVLIDCARRTCIIRGHGTRCEIYPLAMVSGKPEATEEPNDRFLSSMLRQQRRSQTAWSLCTPKQAAKLLRSTGTKYIMVNVRDSKQPLSQAIDSTLPLDRERGGNKQVGGKSRHQPHPFRSDDDARAGELLFL